MNTSPNLWNGEWTVELATKAILGADTVKSGLFRVEESIKGETAIIKTFNYDADLVEGNFCDDTPTNTSSLADIAVPMKQFRVYEQPCKSDLINTSYADYMRNGVFNDSIPQEVLEAFVEKIARVQLKNLEILRWSGDTASASPKRLHQDGVVKQLLAAAGTVRPTFVAGALLNPTTVIDELNKLILNAPVDVRFNPNFSIVVSPEVLAAYQAAVSSNQAYATYNVAGMYTIANQQTNAPAYVGQFVGYNVKMYVATGLSGFNADCAMAMVLTDDMEGNLVLVTDALSDQNNIVIQDRSQTFMVEQKLDFLWSFRQGIKVLFPEQAVLLHA